MRTPESLMRSIPLSWSVCSSSTPSACSAVLACLAMRLASSTIAITIAAATATTTTPSTLKATAATA